MCHNAITAAAYELSTRKRKYVSCSRTGYVVESTELIAPLQAMVALSEV